MVEEKENKTSRGSKKLQITFNMEIIEKMETRAEQLGLNLNQYFLYVVARDIEKNLINKK